MKAQQTTNLNIKEYFQHVQRKQIKCIKGNSGVNGCMNSECQKYAFMCNLSDCLCNQEHPYCPALVIDKFILSAFNKIIPTKSFQNSILTQIQSLIQQLSRIKDRFIQQMNGNKFKLYGISKDTYQFAESIYSGNVDQISGKKIWKALLNNKKDAKIQKLMQKEELKIKQSLFQIKKDIQKMQIKMFQSLKDLQNASNNDLDNGIFLGGSKIVKQNQQIEHIVNFFDNKKIKKLTLLYRASQNQYQTKKFHQKCHNIPHTLTLCETQFNKKIGGYTPLIWNKVESGNYAFDQHRRSFIFSLTNNEKLTINPQKNQQYQIYCRNDYGPIWGGGCDFVIGDKANSTNTSHSSGISHTYVNKNYPVSNQQSYKRFSGAVSNCYFKIKQWQVWSIQFEK